MTLTDITTFSIGNKGGPHVFVQVSIYSLREARCPLRGYSLVRIVAVYEHRTGWWTVPLERISRNTSARQVTTAEIRLKGRVLHSIVPAARTNEEEQSPEGRTPALSS